MTGAADGGGAQCATIRLPLDWDEPEGKSIDLFLKRRRRTDSVGQIWMLAGGPGQAGSSYEPYLATYDRYLPPLDIYLLDHRGTGKSSPLGCPNAEDPDSASGTAVAAVEIASCLSELDPDMRASLPYFSVTSAARDLGYLIERFHVAGRPTVVMGVSYGAQWAQRYLALYPDQPSAVVLDSTPVDGELSYLSVAAGGVDEMGKQLLDLCANMPECASRLGGDPRAAMGEAIQQTDSGHCADHITNLRQKVGYLLRTSETRNLIPALIHRVLRCSERDQAALSAFSQWFNTPQDEELGFSDILRINIDVSEYMPIPAPTLEEANAYVRSLWFVQADPRFWALASDAWPAYPRDDHWGQLSDTTGPMLMLQGGLDPLAPPRIAAPVREHFRGPHQTYVEVPYSTHDIVLHSDLASDGDGTCGGLLLQQFLADPEAALDTSCTAQVQAPTFTADDDVLLAVFGTTDLWGDSPVLPAP